MASSGISQPEAIAVVAAAVTALLAVGYLTGRPAALACAVGALLLVTGIADELRSRAAALDYPDPPGLPYTFAVVLALPAAVVILFGQLAALHKMD